MRCAIALSVLVGFMGAGGCDQAVPHRARKARERAEEHVAKAEFTAALASYEEALNGTRETADIHYRMAILYDDKVHDPVGALHHFRRYLELSPTGAFAGDAESFIREAEVRVISVLTKGVSITEHESTRLRNENLDLRKQIGALRAAAKSVNAEKSIPTADPVKKAIPAGGRTYVVRPGDTLAGISRRFYKTPARWKDIQDANFNQLEGTVTLKPGQELFVPQ